MEGYCLMHFLSIFCWLQLLFLVFYILYRKCRKFVLSKIFIFFDLFSLFLFLVFFFLWDRNRFFDCGLFSSLKNFYEINKIYEITNKKNCRFKFEFFQNKIAENRFTFSIVVVWKRNYKNKLFDRQNKRK